MPNLADIIEPMPGKIAVLVATKDEITPGGLYIPVETARSIHEVKATQGTIIAMGDESLEDAETSLKIGDLILFGKYSGSKIEYQPDRTKPKEVVILLMHKDVLCKLNIPEESENLTVKG